MICPQCQTEVPDGSGACSNCGADLSAVAANAPQAPAAPPPAVPPPAAPAPGFDTPAAAPAAAGQATAFNFDLKRLTTMDWVTAGATFVLLISLFLPWITASFSYSIGGVTNSQSNSASGLSLHGYFYLVLLLCLVVIAYYVLKAGLGKLPFDLPVPEEMALLIVTGVSFVIVLLGFLFKGYHSGSAIGAGYSYSVGWGFGAFLGLLAAIVAVVPLALPVIKARSAAK
jgi:hypothetical protein